MEKCVLHDLVCVRPMFLLTWAGGAWSGSGGRSGSTHQQGLLVFSQSLLSQIALPLHLQLQGLGNIGYNPVNGSQHEEHHVLVTVKTTARTV